MSWWDKTRPDHVRLLVFQFYVHYARIPCSFLLCVKCMLCVWSLLWHVFFFRSTLFTYLDGIVTSERVDLTILPFYVWMYKIQTQVFPFGVRITCGWTFMSVWVGQIPNPLYVTPYFWLLSLFPFEFPVLMHAMPNYMIHLERCSSECESIRLADWLDGLKGEQNCNNGFVWRVREMEELKRM